MAYLLDTNVISEYRKGDRANWGVRYFFATTDTDRLFLPVQVIGEIRAGITKLLRNEQFEPARIYTRWLDGLVDQYGDRIIDFDRDAAQTWGLLLSGQKKDPHTIDKQIAAIALIRDMTVVTRDTGEAFSQVPNLKVFNPFQDPPDDPNDERYALAA